MNFHVTDNIRFLLEPRGYEDSHVTIRSERAMWRAVIVQALMDAASKSRKPEAMYHKHEAAAWLSGGSRDFAMVCEFAGFNASYVRRMAKRSLLAGCKWRAEPGKEKPRSRIRGKEAESSAHILPDDEEHPACAVMILDFPFVRHGVAQ